MQIRRIMPLLILSVNTVTDLKKHEISLVCTGIGWVSGLFDMIYMKRTDGTWMLGICFGIAFILASLFSRGKIGMGDGLVILTLSTVIEIEKLIMMVSWAFLLCRGVSFVLKRKRRISETAWIPFLFAGYLLENLL